MRVRHLAWVLLVTAGCGSTRPDGTSVDGVPRCNAQQATGGMCVEHLDPISDTARLSILARCREAGGELVERCPVSHLVGVCERAEDTSKAWTLNRVSRVHHYLHPDVASPDAAQRLAARCAPPHGTWTPAPQEGQP